MNNFKKLEVGRKYKTRKGDVVIVESVDRNDEDWPYKASNEKYYTEDGYLLDNCSKLPGDLVELLPAEDLAIEIRDRCTDLDWSTDFKEISDMIIKHTKKEVQDAVALAVTEKNEQIKIWENTFNSNQRKIDELRDEVNSKPTMDAYLKTCELYRKYKDESSQKDTRIKELEAVLETIKEHQASLFEGPNELSATWCLCNQILQNKESD